MNRKPRPPLSNDATLIERRQQIGSSILGRKQQIKSRDVGDVTSTDAVRELDEGQLPD
jgi:hypothetical protein